MKLWVFLETFLQHCHAGQDVLILLKLHSVFFFGQLSSVVFYHLMFKLIECQSLWSEKRKLSDCRFTGHIISRYHSKFCSFITRCIDVQDNALIDLTDVYNNCSVCFLFLCVGLDPFIEISFCRNVSHSKRFNHQILVFWNAIETKRGEFHDTNRFFEFVKYCWNVLLTW